jgi:alkyl hydroperoxide reductase subunit AhpC
MTGRDRNPASASDNNKNRKQNMAIRLGDIAPDFTADTTEGEVKFHHWLGEGWGVLFSHPADFTPVCTTELGTAAKLKSEFARRNVKVLAVSVDPLESHQKWIQDINETQACNMNFPIIADAGRKVATAYDMIHPNADDKATVRSVFVIGPDKKVKLTITYPASTGRNFAEILRVIDSLQLTAKHKVATPADWKDGQDCIVVPAVTDEDAAKLFPKGVESKALPALHTSTEPTQRRWLPLDILITGQYFAVAPFAAQLLSTRMISSRYLG